MSTESRAVYITAVGKVEIQDAPKLAIPAGYLLVKTKAVALNPTDWKSVDWSNGDNIGSRLGVDYAGVVEDFAPDVKGWSKGDRVCGMVWGGKDGNNGAFGDYIIAVADLQLKVPDNLSFEAAATVGVAITTVGQALYQLLELPLPPAAPSSPPQTLLIGGGSTATAVVGIQYAKLSGLKVIATASPYNFDYLRSLGVDELLDYHEDANTLVRKIREITGDDLTLAWDTSPNDHYPSIAARALSSTKKSVFATVNPLIPEGFLKDVNPLVDAKFQLGYSIFGEAMERGGRLFPASPEDVEFGKKFWNRSGKLFAEDKIQTTRFELNRGGQSWEGVLHGLQDLRAGNVKGTKLVYNVDPLWGNEASRNTNPEISPRLSSVTSEPDTYYQLFDTMRPSIVLACLVGAVSAQRSQAELDQLDKDTTCVNSSFDKTFPGGSCTTDPACVCNQQQYRQDWLCMVAKRCRPEAFYDQIATIQRSCAEFGKSISLDFDTQSLCGFKQPVATGTLLFYPMSSTSSSQALPASTANGEESKTAPLSNAAAATSSSQAAAETSGAKTTPNSQASSASSSAAPSKSADASAKTGSGSMLAVSNLAVVLAGVGLAL